MTKEGKGLSDGFEQAPTDRLHGGDVIMIGGAATEIVAEYPENERLRGNWFDHTCPNWQCRNSWRDQTECAQCPLCGSSATSTII